MVIANVCAIIVYLKLDNDDSDWEVSEDKSEDPGDSASSSNIEEEDLNNYQEVLHLGQGRHDKTIQTIRVPLPQIPSCGDTIIACTVLPNL
jgi:hypothetical protein